MPLTTHLTLVLCAQLTVGHPMSHSILQIEDLYVLLHHPHQVKDVENQINQRMLEIGDHFALHHHQFKQVVEIPQRHSCLQIIALFVPLLFLLKMYLNHNHAETPMNHKTADRSAQVNSKRIAGILWNDRKLVIDVLYVEQINSRQDQPITNRVKDQEMCHRHNNVQHPLRATDLPSHKPQDESPGKQLSDHKTRQIK